MTLTIATTDTGWMLSWADTQFDLTFADGILRNTWYGPTLPGPYVKPPINLIDSQWRDRPEAELRLGPRQTPVLWDSATALSQPDALELTLTAAKAALTATLTFAVDPATGTLCRRTTVANPGTQAVDITVATSLCVNVQDDVRDLIYLSGEWGGETQVNRTPADRAPFSIESRSGRSGFEYNPWLALDCGDVTHIIQVLWSGNWRIEARRRWDGTAISAGLPRTGFCHTLPPGATLTLPEVLALRVTGDLDTATRRLHDIRRARRPDPDLPIPVQFNSWYPNPGEPDVATMLSFIPGAAALGCEVFVLDAGWYRTEQPSNENWWARAGDWLVNEALFPNGIEELADACRAAGMGFGIWFEPEAVSSASAIRKAHPEWLHHVDGLDPDPTRREILNLGIPAAREHVRDRMLAVLHRTQAVWLKWDFNTELRAGGWAPGTGPDPDPVIAHYEGLHLLQDEIRAACPGLVLEMCSSGGGRFDGRLMTHAHTNWMSDQVQPLRNLSIHFGSHRAHPAVACNDWLIDWPPKSENLHLGRWNLPDDRGDLIFRMRVAMLGSFGISAPLTRWTEAEIATARAHVDWYKTVARPLVHHGDQYILTDQPPLDGNGDWAAMWFAAKDGARGMGLFFRLGGDQTRRFALPGLDPAGRFRVMVNDAARGVLSGADLASGIDLACPAPYTSATITAERLS
jgi:alpha-galactosidase